jgi:hypothetical protein
MGGATATGGAAISGGSSSTGGTAPSTGGVAPTTGGIAASGGAPTTGGIQSSGGTSGVPGTTGGSSLTGGSSATGGSVTTGGAPSSGGSAAEGGLSGGGLSGGGTSVTGGSAGAMNGGQGGATAGGGKGGAANLKGTMVVRGAGTATAGDTVMIDRMKAHGFSTITVVSDAAVTATSVAGSALVVISSSAESGPLQAKLKDITIPVLCVEDAEFKLMGMASSGGHDAGISQMVVSTAGSPLLGSLSGTVKIASQAGELGWGTPAAAALKAATMPGDPSHVVVFGYEKGAQMATMVAPARRAGFAIREALAANLSADGIKAFDAILDWVMQ